MIQNRRRRVERQGKRSVNHQISPFETSWAVIDRMWSSSGNFGHNSLFIWATHSSRTVNTCFLFPCNIYESLPYLLKLNSCLWYCKSLCSIIIMLNFLDVHLINCLHLSFLVPPQEERPFDLQPPPRSWLYYKPPSNLFVLRHRSCFIILSAEHVFYSAVFISHSDVYVPFAFTIPTCPVSFIIQPWCNSSCRFYRRAMDSTRWNEWHTTFRSYWSCDLWCKKTAVFRNTRVSILLIKT